MNARSAVLYIGQLFEGSTCENRRRMLEHLGYPTLSFDVTPYTGYARRWLRTAAHRLNIGPPVQALNRDLLEFLRSLNQPVDYVWIDKGKWFRPDTLQALRAATGATLIHYTPDAQLLDNRSHLFRASLPIYDVMFTTKPFEVELYRRHGAREIHLINQSYDSRRLYPRTLTPDDQRRFEAEVSFIGHCQPHYAKYLLAASRAAERLRIWGPGWTSYARRRAWARRAVGGDGVWGEDYAKALSGAAIGLCLLSKRIPETTTTRTFEIPGCGTFMLAERTDLHRELFEEGVEAEFFADREEMTDKIRFYLRKPLLRKRVAAAGHRRCFIGGYSDLHRIRQILEIARRARAPGAESAREPSAA